MDMLIQIEKQKYHFEFQLLEDNMAIRMYEYSAKETIREIERKLFILIPFQQVQLNNRMNNISRRSAEAKHQITLEMYKFHQDVKKGLELLEHLGEVPQLLRDKIMVQMDLEILKDWFKLAIKVESITEFEKKIGE